jgi:hypothetical protein
MSQGNYTRREIASKVMEYLSEGGIRVHPYDRVVDMVGEISSLDKDETS